VLGRSSRSSTPDEASGWQIRGAVRWDHEDGLDLDGCHRSVRRVIRVIAATGLLARAAIVAPLDVLFIAVRATYDAARGGRPRR
jgi:hypothetical protein